MKRTKWMKWMPAVLTVALLSFNIVGYAAENTAAPEAETAAAQAA